MPSPDEELPVVQYGDKPPVDWRDLPDDDEDPDDEEMAETPDYVIEVLGFDPLEDDGDRTDAWEESKHPRGQPGNAGQFGSGGGAKKEEPSKESTAPPVEAKTTPETRTRKPRATVPAPSHDDQRKSASGISAYLGMVASMQEQNKLPANMTAPARFVLNRAKQFFFDDATFKGRKGRAHECYRNAGLKALVGEGTYVEGYVLVHGVPIAHAWLVDKEGKITDPTIRDATGIGGYFGVPIKTEYLSREIQKSKVWGLFDWMGSQNYLKDDPEKILADVNGGDPLVDAPPKAPPVTSASHLLEKYSEKISPEQLLAKQPRAVRDLVDSIQERFKDAVPTSALVSEGGHKQEDGTYTPERQRIHADIVKRILTPEAVAKAKPKPGEVPTYTVIGGRGGSGKSYFTTSGVVDKDTFVIDSDVIKSMIPEYEGWNAALVHEESNVILSRIDSMARELGINVAYDSTLRTYHSTQQWIDAYHTAGYKVTGLYCFCPPQEAAERAINRFVKGTEEARKADPDTRKTGRYVTPSYILSSTTNESTFDALRDSCDDWSIYNSRVRGSPPELVASK